jgi:quercetin dioxygenase-like cupin family protein
MSARARHVRAGEGDAIWMAGDTYTLKATAESTGGSLALLEASIPPGCGPPPHTHGSEDEAFYMLAGTLEISAGADTILARSGDFVFMPRDTPHRFKNTGIDAARALILFAPAGFERFFELAGAAARPGEQAPPPDDNHLTRVVEIASRHGVHIHTPEEVA